jgi:hypothetical protein
MEKKRLPQLIIASDWSKNDEKRWMVRAELIDQESYIVSTPEPVGQPETLFTRIKNQVAAESSVLIGFDFPIGLPADYARKIGVSDFRTALSGFGIGDWRNFYEITDTPNLYQPFSPRPKGKGEKGEYLKRLVTALGYKHKSELLRRCDRKTKTRLDAECLFFTCGGKQVGAGAIVGWRDVITPALDEIKIWPFDGAISSLISSPGITVAEIYPGEAYSHLNIRMGSGSRHSKRNRVHRRDATQPLLKELQSGPIRLSHAAQSWFDWGFLDEDDFDAMVGLLSILLVITGKSACQTPSDENVRKFEGWILGQAYESAVVNPLTDNKDYAISRGSTV